MGLLDSFKKLVAGQDFTAELKSENDRILKTYKQRVEAINSLAEGIGKLSDEELAHQSAVFRERLQQGERLDDLLVEAFAVAREATWRVLELRPFDVQLIGGMALHEGRLAEMATGEGKTLAAVLAVYLNALGGDGAYVVTTNDYLARRDGEALGRVYRFLGLSVGVVQAGQTLAQRLEAYSCDVTYVSNQELGFDFLRDNLAMTPDSVVQRRPYSYCIVDEADSILLDEARNPLTISRPGATPALKHTAAARIAETLRAGRHYTVDVKNKRVELTPAGYSAAEKVVGKGLFDLQDPWAFYIINAVKARELFNRDRDYIVQDGALSLVDAFTGRVLLGRRFSDGLQQALEAKEGLQVSVDTQVMAKVTYQFLFRLFPKLAGMTGTAMSDSAEFFETYQLRVFPVPTALPVVRVDYPDVVFRSQQGKTKALLRSVVSRHEKGQPVLIGTTSVEASQQLAQALRAIGIEVQVLNARPEDAERESLVVAQAGRPGAVTVATNMAGCGTDILLGGSSTGLASALVKHMLLQRLEHWNGTALQHATGGVDIVHLNIEVTAQHLGIALPAIPTVKTQDTLYHAVMICADMLRDDDSVPVVPADAALPPSSHQPPPAASIGRTDKVRDVTPCTPLRVEELLAAAADVVLLSDPRLCSLRTALQSLTREFEVVMAADRERVKELGGLYVVGTARHQSRRIDQQLRGRAGRQGDPGASRYFLSLEDDLFRVFGTDKLTGLMQSFRESEEVPIGSELVDRALDKMQARAEDQYRGVRRQVYRLDEVAAHQRAVVYSQRRAYLTSSDEGMLSTLEKYCMQTADEIHAAAVTAAAYDKGLPRGAVNATRLCGTLLQLFPGMQLSPGEVAATPPDQLPRLLHGRVEAAIKTKKKQIKESAALAGSSGGEQAWSLAALFRHLTLVQVDEAWCLQLTRLQLLQEEMLLLQSFTAERAVMETYREKAMQIFAGVMDTVRRNAVYSLFAYNAGRTVE